MRYYKAIRITGCIIETTGVITAILIIFIGSYGLWDKHRIEEDADGAQYSQYRPTQKGDAWTYDEIKEINPEVIGWIKLKDTSIDHPLLQAEDNDKYLTLSATGEFSMTGSLFLDHNNRPDFSDAVSIIYGHHMNSEYMFGCLSSFLDRGFFRSHQYGYIVIGDKMKGIDVIGVAEVSAYDSDVYSGFNDSSHIQKILSKSIFVRSKKLNPDKLLILSTCVDMGSDDRIILMCEMTDKVKFPLTDEEETKSANRSYVRIILILLLVFALILTYIWMRRRKHINRRKDDRHIIYLN